MKKRLAAGPGLNWGLINSINCHNRYNSVVAEGEVFFYSGRKVKLLAPQLVKLALLKIINQCFQGYVTWMRSFKVAE